MASYEIIDICPALRRRVAVMRGEGIGLSAVSDKLGITTKCLREILAMDGDPHPRPAIFEIVCPGCSKTFRPRLAKKPKQQQFCSHQCRAAERRRKNKIFIDLVMELRRQNTSWKDISKITGVSIDSARWRVSSYCWALGIDSDIAWKNGVLTPRSSP